MNTAFKLKTVLLLVFTISLFNCGNDDDLTPPQCDATNTQFNQLYTTTLSSNPSYDNYVSMDLLTHEYTFKVTNNQTVCKVGYQGNADLFAANIPYTIEIFDVVTGTVIYSDSHVFDPTNTDYQPITPTALLANQDYIVRRIVTNYNNDIGTTIGRILRFNLASGAPNPYPFSNTELSISASNFYGTGGPVPDFGIPYIDLVFQSN